MTPSRATSSRATPSRPAAAPLYRQLYDRLRGQILSGELAPGDRLPSARSLAGQLGVARGTVDLAFDLLAGEGYVVAQGPAGRRVAPQIALVPPPRPRRRAAAEPVATEPALPRDREPMPFQMGLPALDAFPRKLWARLAARAARRLAPGDLVYQDPLGDPDLRAALAGYLGIARGIACRPDQVIVTAGYQGALGLLLRALMPAGGAAWLEDPGYFLARHALAQAGLAAVPVPVDADGLDVAAGLARAPEARLAIVTPAHQSPTGVMLALPRRLALLDWAARAAAWIVEDDYDGEYRYQGRPLPALKSLDDAGRVLYAGTFSKVLFPGLRLGYLVVPDAAREPLRRAAELLQPAATPLAQRMVAGFIADGHLGRHIRRMRALYAQRRAALATALRRHLGDAVETPPGGMHLILRLPRGANDGALAARARAEGLSPHALSAFGLARRAGPALLLSFTNVPAERAPALARRLARIVRDS